MKTITVAASKGGVGKSTIAAALAVQAMKGNARVALLDWEPQGSLTLWWVLRGKPENPRLIRDVEDPADAVERLEAEGFDWVIIDTPPAGMEQIERAIEAADFVLIPVKASVFDLHAVRPVATLCKEIGRPFAFVLNAEEPTRAALSASAAENLGKIGPVLTERIRNRTAYVSAHGKGLTGPEHPDSKQAKEPKSEIEPLWAVVKRRAKR